MKTSNDTIKTLRSCLNDMGWRVIKESPVRVYDAREEKIVGWRVTIMKGRNKITKGQPFLASALADLINTVS